MAFRHLLFALGVIAMLSVTPSDAWMSVEPARNAVVDRRNSVFHLYYGTTSDSSALNGFAWLTGDGCFRTPYNSRDRFVSYECSQEDNNRVKIYEWDPVLSPQCTGEHVDVHEVTDGDRLTAIYGADTTVRVSCKLPLIAHQSELDSFMLQELIMQGTCTSHTSYTSLPGQVTAYMFYKNSLAATNISIITTDYATVLFPCTDNATTHPNCNYVCSQITTGLFRVSTYAADTSISFNNFMARTWISYDGEIPMSLSLSNGHAGSITYVSIVVVLTVLMFWTVFMKAWASGQVHMRRKAA